MVERAEYQSSAVAWHSEYKMRCNLLDQSRASRRSDGRVNMSTNSVEFHPSQSEYSYQNSSGMFGASSYQH